MAEHTADNDATAGEDASASDPVFAAEQAHLTGLYAKLLEMRDAITADLESSHSGARQDLIDMSEEVHLNFTGWDETMESLAAVEGLNQIIDAYNQYHDANVEKLKRVTLALMQPYFAKVALEMRPGRPARDVYIGNAGITAEHGIPLVVDWRSPVAETYYSQQMGPVTYHVDGRAKNVNLTLRRQFDIVRDRLNMYFDTSVAIEDSLLLGALKRHHSEKLQAITATIQREQNEVVRHADVPVLLVNGIAGSGKTSVLLQRIAFVLYRERGTLSPDQVWLFTPNAVFQRYIDTVLPSMGEANPQTFTWADWVASQGAGERNLGADTPAEHLHRLEEGVAHLALEPEDVRDVRAGVEILIKAGQVHRVVEKYEGFGIGPKFVALVTDELHDRLEKRFGQIARMESVQEEVLSMDVERQVEVFGSVIAPENDDETFAYAKRYVKSRFEGAHGEIDRLAWLKFDRIGMRLLGQQALSATEWLYLRLLFTGTGERQARFVMVDEVQDYTEAQLMVLSRWFEGAHFMLLGDEHQAIAEGTATFDQIRAIFEQANGPVDECRLLTSYRSSPEITELFCSLLEPDERRRLTSVQRPGTEPDIHVFDKGDVDGYLGFLRGAVAEAHGQEGLTAVVTEGAQRMRWLAKQLGGTVQVADRERNLPRAGVVLLTVKQAKGLEFDRVIIPDAQAEAYPGTPLARRRLYTAISRAMHRVTIASQGPLTPHLAHLAK